MRNVLKVQKKIIKTARFTPARVKPTILIAPKWLEAIGVDADDTIIIEVEQHKQGARLVISAEIPF